MQRRVRRAMRSAIACDPRLLDAALEALAIARDNKAIVVASDGRILEINQHACELYGGAKADLLGKNLNRHLLAYLPASPAGAFEQRWETVLLAAAGTPIPVEIVRQRLGALLPMVEVYAIRDLRARHAAIEERDRQDRMLMQRDEELSRQNLLFNTAIDNMSQGVCLFDAEQRIVFANRRYGELYGLGQDLLQPGTTLRRILEARVESGVLAGIDGARFVAEGIASFRSSITQLLRLSDGRSINVVRRPIVDGGVVSTHEDVTERETLHSQLARQNTLLKEQEERLRRQNIQFDAALNNMVQGLAMFDAEQKLVLCNRRYAEIYGLTGQQTQPGTPLSRIIEYRISNGLHSEKLPEEVIDSMLHKRDGTRARQFINQLSDGRSIAITIQPMADGGTVTTHHDITEQRRSEAKIAHLANHDSLTELANRALLNERLGHALATVPPGQMVAAHLLDLDHFKNVNDTLGHPIGDELLRMIASRLRGLMPASTTIARMGGDEFVVLQTIAQTSEAATLAQRIIAALGEPYDVNGHHVVTGTSIGIATASAEATAADQLLRNADLALYRAKGSGRNTFCFYEQDMDAQMQQRRAMELDLRKALASGEFELHYQPIVNLQRNEVSGVEALIRWRHPEKGMISPGAFIPLAEENGLIVPIGEWALRTACFTVAKWPSPISVSVNLSAVQFRAPGLIQVVINSLAASGLAPSRLELEITESVLLENSSATLDILYKLREVGVRIAMDDFGTGYSSLSYLQSFPFDKIKIDRSFIRDIADRLGSLNIVRAVTALAKGLGMATTAEGVETQEQLETVKSEGCTEMQGFLFSRPRPAHEIEHLFIRAASEKPADAKASNAA